MKTFIIGKGKVGRATQKVLGDDVPFHDPYQNLTIDTPNEYELAIVCVPSLINGPTDYYHIEQVLEYLQQHHFEGIVAIRSTIDPLSIRYFINKYASLNIILFPEFMKQSEEESNDNPWVVVVGCDSNELRQPSFRLAEFLKQKKYGHTYTFCSVEEAATIKLFQNATLAAKVTIFNTLYQYCKKLELNFEAVKYSVAMDPRIGLGHTDVPGPDTLLGFGGHCLPKDMAALIKSFESLDLDSSLWENVRDYNQRIRNG